MPELGIPYTLIGPDGTRAVFNDPTDPDFVGYFDDTGITGLLDTADVREDTDVLTEADGSIQGNNYLARKTGTISGFIWPSPDIISVNARETKIKRASRGLKANEPSVLTWTPSGGDERRLEVWRQGKVTVQDRRPKKFLIPLATSEPFHSSSALHQQTITPGGTGGDSGFSSPIVSPFSTNFNVADAQGFVINAGDAITWPAFAIYGPIQNPTLVNNTTGEEFTLTWTLAAGELLAVDSSPLRRTVILNGTTNRYNAYSANASTNTWWSLLPGANDIRVLTQSFSTGAQITVAWRDRYE